MNRNNAARDVAGGGAGRAVTGLDLFGESAGAARDVVVTSVEYDSRKVVPGSCFVALKGFSTDGRLFVGDAVGRGAGVIVVEGDSQVDAAGRPMVRVADVRRELARISARFYGHPSRKLGVVGITGTNGKTTTSYMVQAVLAAAGHSVSRFGTIDYEFPDGSNPAPNTTPESADLQRMFARAAGWPNARCVIEVSSHGLEMDRLAETEFKGAVFTNLTRDHLDFHRTMEKYEDAKRRLFTEFDLGYSVINVDDEAGRRWAASGVRGKLFTFGAYPDAVIRILESSAGIEGGFIRLATPAGEVAFKIPMPGKHNVQNATAAFCAGLAEGIPPETAVRAISGVKAVPGRFEKVDEGQDFAVIVDYAHTDDALEKALRTARELTKKRLICLFGCGGDRDEGKRPKMGRVASELADVVIVTSDNPRTEDPKKIIEGILAGVPRGSMGRVKVVESRAEAVKEAVGAAQSGDLVLLAGKGHEDYQIIGRTKFPFDDRKAAADAIRGRRA